MFDRRQRAEQEGESRRSCEMSRGTSRKERDFLTRKVVLGIIQPEV